MLATSNKAAESWRMGADGSWVGHQRGQSATWFSTLRLDEWARKEKEDVSESWAESTTGWVQCGLSCRSSVLTSCIPSKAQRKIQSIWECDPPSPSPHHTHKNGIFLAMLICCLSLQTGLHKKGLFFSPQGCRGVKLHTDGKAIYTLRSSQCSWGEGVGGWQTPNFSAHKGKT